MLAREIQENWVEIYPPHRIDFYVYQDFVSNGVAGVNDLNVRVGPGISYSVVGQVNKGRELKVRGSEGEWLKIRPPYGSSLWLSRAFARIDKGNENVMPIKNPEPAVAGKKKASHKKKPIG